MIAIAAAIGIACWNHAARIDHVNHVSNLAGGDTITVDATSPTGYEFGFRKLIVPEKSANSFQWIMQVQEMFDSGEWRLRHVDYDNAPDGRSVRTASPYRWWMGSIAWIDHVAFGNPIGISVERAALYADPAAQLLALLITALFIARSFSGPSAAIFSIGFVAIFPIGAAFAPGQPGDATLLIVFTMWSVFPLLAGLKKASSELGDSAKTALRRHFFIGGFFGGMCLWIGVSGALPLLAGIAVAGAISGYLIRRRNPEKSDAIAPVPWRAWALGGAAASLIAWFIDRSPAYVDPSSWRADFVHPLYSFAWWGCGEVLTFLDRRAAISKRSKRIALPLAGISICGLAYTMLFDKSQKAWSIDPIDTRLTRLSIDPGVSNIADWFAQDGLSGSIAATLIPILLLLAGVAALLRSKNAPSETRLIAFALAPAIIVFCLATTRLGWWIQLDALALIVAAIAYSAARKSQWLRWNCGCAIFLASSIGLSIVLNSSAQETENSVNRSEVETLVERHLAQWLARRSANTREVTLAPPNATVSLSFYGNLRGIGTPYPENVDGFSAAVRLCAASTADEARALASGREIGLIVHPSWDSFLEDYARLGSEQPESSFIALLNRWLPPRWLEPVSFRLPSIPGFEDEWVVIYRSVEIQDNTSAIGRLVEYFLDSGRGNLAMMAQKALSTNFSDELVTHITAAEVAIASGDRETFDRSVESIIESIESGSDFYLTWEFRVNMSLVLAGAKKVSESKTQLERCLEEANTDLVRRLSNGSLSGFLRLASAFEMDFKDPETKAYAISLLPAEQRKEL